MLLGIYKSFEELENHLTIDEMNLLLKAGAKKEERLHRVLAAVNGIKWDDHAEDSAEDVVERLKKKADAAVSGWTDEQIELEEMGIKFG